MNSFVTFIGSGPGNPELLTIKAVDRLKNAKVILYDDLSSGDILKYANKNAILVSVGKRAGLHSPKQTLVNKLLIEYASRNTNIVRLKSGDCGIFGRLEEEIEALSRANIEYEVIPGISTPLATAASLGIPLTRRIESRRLQFITGHDIRGNFPEDLNMKALCDLRVTTVIFMGKKTFVTLAEKLIRSGLPDDTTVIFAEAVSLPEEKVLHTTIKELVIYLSDNKKASKAPAIIIYGPIMKKKKIKK